MLVRYPSVEELLAARRSDAPVFCFFPARLRAVAARFVAGFAGLTLYAVKANPHPDVLRWLAEGGITGFDTASLAEMELVAQVCPGAHRSYNHPVKPRAAIRTARHTYGVTDFVVDHEAELDKLIAEAGSDLTVQVRLAAPNPHATISFNAKFGAPPERAVALMREVARRGATPALSTHLGYQTTDPAAYTQGIALLAEVTASAGVRPAYVNLGGGFPSVLMPPGRTLEDFFAAIATAHAREALLEGVPLRCEPGSALAHPGGAVLTQVLLVRDDAVFVNDGVYGAMAELIHSRIQPPTRVLDSRGAPRRGAPRRFTVFGPTCDSYDTIPVPFALPADTREGDWLELSLMGAYSNVLITDFNGLGAHDYAVIGG